MASASTASGRSCRRSSTATRRTGCCCARTTRPATTAKRRSRARATARCSRPRRTRFRRDGSGLYEPKWDGYRAIVTVAGGEATFTSRNGIDLTERFREVARAAQLGVRLGRGGSRRRGRARSTTRDGRASACSRRARGTLVLVASTCSSSTPSRSSTSRSTSGASGSSDSSIPRSGGCSCLPQFDDGDALLAAARAQGLEGVVAKRARLPYQPGRRSPEWRKLKVRQWAGGRRRRLHEGPGPALGRLRRSRRRGARGGRAALGRQRRHRVHGRRDRPRC